MDSGPKFSTLLHGIMKMEVENMAKVALELELEQLARAIMNLPPKNVSGFGVCSPLWKRSKIRVPLRPFANRKLT